MISLTDTCVNVLLKNVAKHLDDIQILPCNLKDKFFQIMMKRGKVTDANISKIIHEKVTYMDLSECEISDSGLSKVAICRNLRVLHLNAGKNNRITITSAGLNLLFTQCIYLQAVYLRRCINIMDNVIETLAQNCPNLIELNLGGCLQITDASLLALGKNCAKLQSIQFSKTKVTDYGVLRLVSGACRDVLKEIVMNGCQELSDDAVEIVITHCANISILVFHDCPNITDHSRQMLGPHSKVKQIMWTVY